MSVMSFIIAILPVVLIGIFVYNKDQIKESSKLLFKLFVGGIISCFPAIILGLILGDFFPTVENMNYIQLFLYVFIVVALVEEFCKWFMLYNISYRSEEFDSLYDMIVYAAFVALGFASFENVLYVYDSGFFTGLVRAFTAVPGHVCDGILMGVYLSLAKYNMIHGNIKLSNKYKMLSIIIPTITHGIYDFCLFVELPLFVTIFIIFVIILFVVCFKKVNQISRNNFKFKIKNNYCVVCGNRITSNFCTMCGNKCN